MLRSSGIAILLELFSQRSNYILHCYFTPGIINQKQINIRIKKLKYFSAPRSWSRVNNTVVLTIMTFQHIQCLHLMYAEVAWALVSSGTQVQPQIIADPGYLSDYLSISHDYGNNQYQIRNQCKISSCHSVLYYHDKVQKIICET